MQCSFVLNLTALTLLSFAASTEVSQEINPAGRPVSVADVIQMVRPANLTSLQPLAHYSPNGKWFVVVLKKGNLERNINDFSMFLWKTAEVFGSPVPRLLTTLSSSSNRDAIEDISWLRDNETIAFLGETAGGLHQLYTFNIATNRLSKRTDHNTNLVSYSITPDGTRVAYVAEDPPKQLFDEKAQRDGLVITSQALSNLLASKRVEATYGIGDQQLFFQRDHEPSRAILVPGQIPVPGQAKPFLSPDGKYIIMLTQAAVIPEDWKEYSEPQLHEVTRRELPPGQYSWLCRYLLINTETGETSPLLTSPVKSWDTNLTWLPDGKSVVIANAWLPLENSTGTERLARQSRSFAVEIQVPSREIAKISDDDLRVLAWKGNQLTFLKRSDGGWQHASKIGYTKVGTKWVQAETLTQESSQPEISVEEDMNTPPRLVAVDSQTHRRAMVLDLNPNFNELNFARVEEIQWKSTDGTLVKGGLYYPVHYERGKKYPLVIQTHGWFSNRFLIDGPYTTAFTAQPLAEKDIMVLQAEQFEGTDWWYKERNTPAEISRYVSAYEGAIDDLDKRGLIDRTHVGIIAFSRTGLYMKHALTHSQYRFAAASVTDGGDGGYFGYIAFNASPNTPKELEGLNGGSPVGQSLQTWLERSPGFNVDRVQTPLLITALRPAALLGEWEWFALLQRLHKPVELTLMQDGSHELQRPWERRISLQKNVDWFCFWLKGEEDPDPAKIDQYRRWRAMTK